MAARAQIIKASELGFNHLQHNKLKVSAEITCTILRKPTIHGVILQLEDFFENFRVVHDFEDIKGVAPNPDELASIGKKIILLREEAGDYLVEQGMAIPWLPHCRKNNNPEQWWNIDDFEILCTSYRHEVEGFLKTVSPYFPRAPKSDDNFPKPSTLSRVTRWNASVSQLPAPRQTKVQRFGDEQNEIPPISTITSQGRLGALLEDDGLNNSPTKGNTEQSTHQEDPFFDKGISKEPSQPPKPSSDNSSLDSDWEPVKPPIPPRSTKRPAAVTSIPDSKPKDYHFDLKLKPELVPQWHGNLDILARWISRINRLVNNSPEIKEEWGKIVLWRFTNFAETWYYSIPDAEHVIGFNRTGLHLQGPFWNIGWITIGWRSRNWGQIGLDLERLGNSEKVPANMLFVKWNF